MYLNLQNWSKHKRGHHYFPSFYVCDSFTLFTCTSYLPARPEITNVISGELEKKATPLFQYNGGVREKASFFDRLVTHNVHNVKSSTCFSLVISERLEALKWHTPFLFVTLNFSTKKFYSSPHIFSWYKPLKKATQTELSANYNFGSMRFKQHIFG